MADSEVILDLVAEGGGVTLYGIRTDQGWRFSTETIDHAASMLGDPAVQHKSQVVSSWAEALNLFDHYPWHMFAPLVIHEEFKDQVFAAVLPRFDSESETRRDRRLPRWKEACGKEGE